jgi:hypothetical protein
MTMIEKVARAICKSRTCTGIKCCEWPCNGGRQTVLTYPNAPRCLVEDGRFDDAAKGAIQAAREPTEQMADYGLECLPEGRHITGLDDVRQMWAAMIDVATDSHG